MQWVVRSLAIVCALCGATHVLAAEVPASPTRIDATAVAPVAGGRVGDTTSAASPALALTVSATAVIAPTAIRLTATVSGTTLSGSVEFRDGPTPIGSAPIKSGKAVLTVTPAVGIHPLVAAYSGAGIAIASSPVPVVVDHALSCP